MVMVHHVVITLFENFRVFSCIKGYPAEQRTLGEEMGDFSEREEEREEMGDFSECVEERENANCDSEIIDSLDLAWEKTSRKGIKKQKDLWVKKKKNQVFLEGYVESGEELGLNGHAQSLNGQEQQEVIKDFSRTKSLTDEDLDELKGCVDLGFGFSYDEIPELCNTLPALELCYSMNQRFMDEQQKSPEASGVAGETPCSSSSMSSSSIANWKISSPGDHPEEVKARLKFWAQTVACTVRLCS